MGGPIVRKYGFPNFDKIFGEKPILHGVDDDPKPEASQEQPSADPSSAKTETPADGSAEPRSQPSS